MPITKSAKKALRRSEVLRGINLKFKLSMKNTTKLLRKAVANGQKEGIVDLFKTACSAIDKAAKKNIIHKNNAARKKSALSKIVNIFMA